MERLKPHFVLFQPEPPDLAGTDFLRAVQNAGLHPGIVLISANGSGDLARRSIAGGATAHLSMRAEPLAISDAVAAIARGETLTSPSVKPALVSELQRRRPLTERELEILNLAAEGCSAHEAGRRLQLSQSTVKTHLRKAYAKLGVSDRAAAVAEAMRRGLIE